jgi:hypothetical protein
MCTRRHKPRKGSCREACSLFHGCRVAPLPGLTRIRVCRCLVPWPLMAVLVRHGWPCSPAIMLLWIDGKPVVFDLCLRWHRLEDAVARWDLATEDLADLLHGLLVKRWTPFREVICYRRQKSRESDGLTVSMGRIFRAAEVK